MRAKVLVLLLLVAGCASQNEEELRRTPWEHADFHFTSDLEATSAAIHAAAKRCFDGKSINLRRTFVHRERAEDGTSIITAFQLGTFDAAILAQIDVRPEPEGAKVALFRSGSLRLSERLAPFIERWVKSETPCPTIL
jgi:hypothetical protein